MSLATYALKRLGGLVLVLIATFGITAERQKQVLVDIYQSFCKENDKEETP